MGLMYVHLSVHAEVQVSKICQIVEVYILSTHPQRADNQLLYHYRTLAKPSPTTHNNTYLEPTMLTIFTALTTLSLAIAAPLSPKALLPNLPAQADLRTASRQILDEAATFTGRNNQYNNYGNYLQTVVPVANTLDQTITHDKVTEIDILADRLCIAGKGQGSLCNEIIGYAYAWYVAQQKGKTYQELATIVGVSHAFFM